MAANGHRGDGGRLRGGHFLLLAGLLILPGWAVGQNLGPRGAALVGGWCLLASGFTYLRYAGDKRQARERGGREPEARLHGLELIGGWPGAFLAQRKLRHKSAKGLYQFVFMLIVGLHQFLAIDALRGWALLRLAVALVGNP